MPKTAFKDVDEYIGAFPQEVQATLKAVRRAIQEAVPEAEEHISYQMPAYRFHGRLLYFAAFKDHYSVFGATRSLERAFKEPLSRYELGKGTIRFPLDRPVPVKLIRDIAAFRAKENLAGAGKRKTRQSRGRS